MVNECEIKDQECIRLNKLQNADKAEQIQQLQQKDDSLTNLDQARNQVQ